MARKTGCPFRAGRRGHRGVLSIVSRTQNILRGQLSFANLLHPLLVWIAPQPALMRLRRGDHRMACRVVMLRGVLVFGGITAADVAAGQASPQMYPGIAHGYTFCTDMGLGWNVFAVCEMFADCHDSSRPRSGCLLRC